MNITDAFEAPIVETINGREIAFPRLVIDDYTKWIAELTAQKRKRALSLVPADAPPGERFQMLQMAGSIEVGLETVSSLIWTVPGSRRVLDLSMAKAGITVEERPALFSGIPPYRFHRLAADVSGLFEPAPRAKLPPLAAAAAAQAEGDPDPNSDSLAEGENDAAGVTGSGTE